MSNIIVTGGAGFIGSHLVRRLVNEGNKVIVIDNLITTKDTKYIKDLIEENSDNLRFIPQDICDYEIVSAYVCGQMRELGIELIDEVYNLASPASVKLYSANPELTFFTSTVGVKNMLNIAKFTGCENVRFLETSTSEIYGDPLVHPQVESYTGNVNTMCTRACYDEGKRSAEVLCGIAIRKGMNVHIARLFNVYGPNNTDDRVVPTLLMQAYKNEDLTVFGDGTQTRSFCYVDDLVDGLIKLQRSEINSPVNLGNPEEVTINELAKSISELYPGEHKIAYLDLPEGDPTRRCPNITKAIIGLDWKPTTSLHNGLLKVKDWIEEIKLIES